MKKILAFTLALAMVLSSATMTFAASKEVEALANLKLLLNTTDAEVNADLNRAVGLAMVLKALGYTQEDANAKAEANTFVDMEKYGWAKGFTVLGEELKITNGTSVEPKMFSPSAKLNERAFVAFMLRALGYDVDAAWAKAGEIAKEAGVAETVTENKLTKGEAAVIMYKALMAKVQGDEKGRTLAQKLVDEKKLDKDLAVANGLISGEPEKLTVTAMADNLIEVTVSFDGTVDKETAEKKENYRIKNHAVDTAKVQEDGRTVVLTLEKALANKKEFDLTVAGVKNVAGVVMDKQTVKFTTNDVTAPTVEKITVTGPKSFEITFSEPMDSESIVGTDKAKVYVKQNKNTLSISAFKKESLKSGNRVLVVKMNSKFMEGKEYTVMVGNGKENKQYPKDYAGYTTVYYEEQLTYTKDTTAPEVKVVKASQEKVTLEFTKPVTGITTDAFYHTFKSYNPREIEVEKGSFDSKEQYSQVTLVFYKDDNSNENRALPAGDVVLTVMGKTGDKKIVDNWGNQLENVDLPLTISADREAPQVLSVEVKGKTLEVTFNEDVEIRTTEWYKDITVNLIDKDGKVVAKNRDGVNKVALENNKNKVAKIELSKDFTGKTLTLEIKGVKDKSIYKNVMSDYTTEIEFKDSELVFDFTPEYQVTAEGKYLYVTFKEEMDDSALELKNYRVRKQGQTDYTLEGSAEFLNGNRKIVAIELTDKDATAITMGGNLDGSNLSEDNEKAANLVASNELKDLAGNAANVFEKSVKINKLSGTAFTIAKARVTAPDTIEVEFTTDIVEFDDNKAHWQIEKFGTDVVLNDYKDVIDTVNRKDGSDKVVELKLIDGKKFRPDVLDADGTTALDVKLLANSFKDEFGRPAAEKETKLVDGIKPEVAKVVKEGDESNELNVFKTGKGKEEFENRVRALVAYDTDQSGDKKLAKLYIVYNEKISTKSLSNTTYSVSEGWAVSSAKVLSGDDDKVVVLELEKVGGKAEELQKLTVAHVNALRDAHGVILEGNKTHVETFYHGATDIADVENGIE